MNSKTLGVLYAALLACAPILAQEVPRRDLKAPGDVSVAPPLPQTRTVAGTVKEFEPGRTLRVQTPDLLETYRLDDKAVTVRVDSSLSVGTDVRVTESEDVNGKRTITVEPRKSGATKKAILPQK